MRPFNSRNNTAHDVCIQIVALEALAPTYGASPYSHIVVGSVPLLRPARLAFDVHERCYDQIFTVENHAAELLGRLRVSPQGAGSFEAAVPLDVVDPRTPIEIRLMMDSGAIEGRLSSWSIEWLRAA